MSCGKCRPMSPDEKQAARTRAAACVLCPHADHGTGAYASGPVACTISGKSVAERYHGAPCPINRVRPDGTVRWAWVVWMGLPMPHRLLLWATHPNHPRISSWAGCGCLKALKTLYERTRSWLTDPPQTTLPSQR